MDPDFIFNEAEALTEPLYVVEPAAEDERKRNRPKQLPDEVFKRVKVEPAVHTVEEHHVVVHAGKENQMIVKADRPKSLLRNSIATPSPVASVYNAKHVNGMPSERMS